MGKINRRVMMIGGAITPPRIPMDWTWRHLAAEIFCQALDSAGLKPADVDLVAMNYNDRSIIDSSPGSQFADALGILPKPVVPVANACAGNGIASYVAWNAVASGRCDVVVSLGFARSDNYDAMESMNSQGNYVDFDFMQGLTHINYGAIRDSYYRQKYDVPIEAAGNWAHMCHWYAQRNPLAATYGKPMPTLDELCEDTPEADRDRQATNRGGVASAMVFVGELAGIYWRCAEWNDLPKTALGYGVCRFCEAHGEATMEVTIPPMYAPAYRRVESLGMEDKTCVFELILTPADDMDRIMEVQTKIFGDSE